MEPKISVVLPVYNGEKTLRNCILAVLGQDFTDFEFIIVDNNSNDKTRQIIKDFEERDKRVRYVFEEKRGRGAARNAGNKYAGGGVIALIDADCIAPKNWLRELTEPILSGKEEVVQGFEKDLVDNYWTRMLQEFNLRFVNDTKNGDYAGHIDTENLAVKAEIMHKLDFDTSLGNMEDFEFYLRLRKEHKILFKPSVAVGHYHRASFKKVMAMYMDRAYWIYRIYKKHRKDPKTVDHLMFGSISVASFIVIPAWAFFQFLKRPLNESYFIFTTHIFWMLGLLRGILTK